MENDKNSKIRALINISVTLSVFALVSLSLIFFERSRVSEIEQRKLAEPPVFTLQSFFYGEYTDKLSEYYNDTVPGRDVFKKAAANIRSFAGVAPDNAQIHGRLTVVAPVEKTDYDKKTWLFEQVETGESPVIETETLVQTDETLSLKTESAPADVHVYDTAESVEASNTETLTETETEMLSAESDEAENPDNEIAAGVYTNGQIVLYQNGHWQGLSMFGGGSGEKYSKYLNRVKSDLSESVSVYSMIIPTAGEFYTPDKFAQYNASQLDSINSINGKLEGIINVDAYSALENNKHLPVYTRTDHHWLPLGAYYAAETFAAAAGVPFTEISEYEQVEIDGYVGTMYTFTESANLLKDPETFVYYLPSSEYKAYYYTTEYIFEYTAPLFVKQPVSQSYSTFMGGDSKIVRIETDIKNGRRLAVIKDSYGNALIPFFTGSFEEIYVIDMRYFTPNLIDFISQNNITDVLFTMCTFSAVGPNASHIETIRTQH